MMKHRFFVFAALAVFSLPFLSACDDDHEGPNVEHCGNAVIDADELCDDGNINSGDGCSATCQVEEGYVCHVPGEACTLEDQTELCGNGALDGSEACDDGNIDSGDGCSASCQVEDGYICDVPGQACVPAPRCGDGNLDSGEVCDDGNSASNDGCSATCQIEDGYICPKPGYPCAPSTCGDGVVDANETCDNGVLNVDYSSDSWDCSTSCQPAHYCGDGLFDRIDRDNGEECDSGFIDTSAEYNGCTQDCKKSLYCGDGSVTHAETCDDGNDVSGDGCSASCQIEAGYLCPKPGEPCFKRLCGNGILDALELCDDGNTVSGDGCSASCSLERGYICPEAGEVCVKTCGDGVINEEAGEQCEDGNTVSGDGCSENCVIEPGYFCPEAGKPCYARACGDGILASGEECDDGNTVSGDGCSNRCVRETNYTCPKAGAPCVLTVCGDGKVEGDEKCDEGTNVTAGCVACQIQKGWQCLTPGAACTNDAVCGNGVLEGSETCDEGTNKTAGCVECVIQVSWICEKAGEACVKSTCGDGKLAHGEECDDGNLIAGDGCSPLCEIEPIFSCTDGVCKPTCGDGLTLFEAGEECDDGNLISGDGCDSQCKIERGYVCTDFTLPNPKEIKLPIVYRDFIRFVDYFNTTGTGDGLMTPAIYNELPSHCKSNTGYRQQYLPAIGKPSPDFYSHCPATQCENAVLDVLGSDGKPTLSPPGAMKTISGDPACKELYTCPEMFKWWYKDVPGINRTITSKITLTQDATDKSRYAFSSASFYPINGQGFATSATPANGEFTSEFRTYFKYTGGEVLTFDGDDDVWVFFNSRLGVDVGGIHPAWEKSITLDNASAASKFKMFPGGIYALEMFHAERCTGGSSFRLTLSGFLNMGTSECSSVCGDGVVRGNEECDVGNVSPDEAAKLGCINCKIVPYCGNGKIEGLEHCDDPADDDCKNCKYDTCGNDTREGKEQCDGTDGLAPGQICLANCRISGCGDGIVDVKNGEECDDGNRSNDDMCTNLCKRPFCGDGVVSVSLGEVCDDGINDGSYNGCGLGCAYLPPRCGDALISVENGEECDDGVNDGSYGTCMSSCKLGPRCGDGIVQEDYEQCDYAAADAPANCSKNCRIEVN